MGLFGSSILFVDRDFGTYVFCFAGLPSFVMAKSTYGLRFDSLGK
jgi:hypothetical protein